MKKFRPYLSIFIVLLLLPPFVSNCERSNQPELVELNKIIPDVVLDIRYATTNNFVGEVLYPSARCFLVKDAALALKEIQQDLKKQGYRLKVYDGYRPLSVQKRMWEILPDSRYVADPKGGSRHNRGYAVDVSLLDIDGNAVLMPTEFDEFSEKAHSDYMDIPEEAKKHRKILRDAMEKRGFTGIDTEWWHFDYKGYEGKPNLDISIDDL